jgi:hypothetical protein
MGRNCGRKRQALGSGTITRVRSSLAILAGVVLLGTAACGGPATGPSATGPSATGPGATGPGATHGQPLGSARPGSREAISTSAAPLPRPVRCGSCWHPPVRESWQIQLSFTPRPPFRRVQMIEVDGFDTPAATVRALHRSLPGRRVVCYLDAGTRENWRPDAAEFPKSLLGRVNGNWSGERWLDIAKASGALDAIMAARIQMCQRKGFDAVDFDNVDGYAQHTGFRLTAGDQRAYDIFLANTAHRLGLSAGLKNDLPQIPRLLPYFDFAVDEQCFQYAECLSSQHGGRYGLDDVVAAGKPVFEIEYHLRLARFCPAANRHNFDAIAKDLNLGSWRKPCR